MFLHYKTLCFSESGSLLKSILAAACYTSMPYTPAKLLPCLYFHALLPAALQRLPGMPLPQRFISATLEVCAQLLRLPCCRRGFPPRINFCGRASALLTQNRHQRAWRQQEKTMTTERSYCRTRTRTRSAVSGPQRQKAAFLVGGGLNAAGEHLCRLMARCIRRAAGAIVRLQKTGAGRRRRRTRRRLRGAGVERAMACCIPHDGCCLSRIILPLYTHGISAKARRAPCIQPNLYLLRAACSRSHGMPACYSTSVMPSACHAASFSAWRSSFASCPLPLPLMPASFPACCLPCCTSACKGTLPSAFCCTRTLPQPPLPTYLPPCLSTLPPPPSTLPALHLPLPTCLHCHPATFSICTALLSLPPCSAHDTSAARVAASSAKTAVPPRILALSARNACLSAAWRAAPLPARAARASPRSHSSAAAARIALRSTVPLLPLLARYPRASTLTRWPGMRLAPLHPLARTGAKLPIKLLPLAPPARRGREKGLPPSAGGSGLASAPSSPPAAAATLPTSCTLPVAWPQRSALAAHRDALFLARINSRRFLLRHRLCLLRYARGAATRACSIATSCCHGSRHLAHAMPYRGSSAALPGAATLACLLCLLSRMRLSLRARY